MELKRFIHVGQDPKSFDCGFFSGYVVSALNRSGGLHFEMSPETVYQKRNEFRSPGNPQSIPLTPDKTTGGLNDPKAMLTYLRFLGCHGYQLTGANPKHPLGSTKDENLIRSTLQRRLPPQAGRDALILSVYAPAKAHWIAILARNANQGYYFVYDPGKPIPPYGFSVSENRLVHALADATVHFTVWRHKETKPIGNTHTIVAGESLSLIAGKHWGDVLLFPLLYDANAATIGQNWNQLSVGARLTIPDKARFTQTQINQAHQRARNWT